MTGTEVFLMILGWIVCIVCFLVVYRLIIRDDPKNGKKLFLMTALSQLYEMSGWVGFLAIVLCFVFPDNVGPRQISIIVIALLIHFGLMFVDGVRDFDKKNRLP